MTYDFYSMAKLALFLEYLIQHGEGDGTTADGIREDMDPLWYKLSEKEQKMVGRLVVLLSELEEE